jgi:hypothetical protein
MFVSSSMYKHELKKLVETEGGELRVAVAFWGKGAVDHIHPDDTRPLRVICNLLSGGTNPKVIEALWERAKANPDTVKIAQCDNLHAKVILGSQQALIGSANLSSNGLSMEDDEVSNWIEAGLLTSDTEDLNRIGKWFEELWSSESVRPISEKDLRAAKDAWNKRRGARTNIEANTSEPFSLGKWTVAQLSDRPAYMIIYRTDLSPTGEKERVKAQKEFNAPTKGNSSSDELYAFERWSNFPEGHSGQIVELVMVSWENGCAPECEGVSRSLNLRRSFKHKNGRESWLHLSVPSPTLLQQPFGEEEREDVTRRIRGSIEKIWKAAEAKNPYGRVLLLSEVVRILDDA